MFELTVLGACGGPLDGANQGFLIKPKGSQDSGYVCIDAGSGLSQIMETLLVRETDGMIKSFYENEYEHRSKYIHKDCKVNLGFGTLSLQTAQACISQNAIYKSVMLFGEIGEYYITHPHLDHVSSLVINSPMIYETNSTKDVIGLPFTIQVLKDNFFNDQVWPDLTEKNGALKLRSIQLLTKTPCKTIPEWDITAFQVSHGTTVIDKKQCYSTVYLIQDRKDHNAILVCGDLESDRVSGSNFLLKIWEDLPNIVSLDNFNAMIIECSTFDANNTYLYGHMSPKHIIWELCRLKMAYGGSLDGLHVIISHVKTSLTVEDPRLTILRQLEEQRIKYNLGDVKFSIALENHTYIL